jgi:DNA repair photolyase
MNRLKEGYVLIPNPRNADRLGRVELSPANVDCIVFWTKNPIPMLGKLEQLEKIGYHYYFQFTLTPYDKSIENNLPSKSELIQAFIALSERTSTERVVWRYDPIFIDETHSVTWHIEQFFQMSEILKTYTERCIISFLDPYKSISDSFRAMTNSEMTAIASEFSSIAYKCGIALFTCAEVIDLSQYGIAHASCIDKSLTERIIGSSIKAKGDANQRAACCCIESVDIGVYDTCPNGCAYCYATSSQKTVMRRVHVHDPKAPMFTGYPTGKEIVTDRTTPSQRENQLSLF